MPPSEAQTHTAPTQPKRSSMRCVCPPSAKNTAPLPVLNDPIPEPIPAALVQKFMEYYQGRNDAHVEFCLLHGIEDDRGIRKSACTLRTPITLPMIYEHLSFSRSVIAHPQLSDNTCPRMAIDIDEGDTDTITRHIYQGLKDRGFIPFVSRSGGTTGAGGQRYHIDIFFSKPIGWTETYQMAQALITEMGHPGLETFPKQAKGVAFGNGIKLPLGIHPLTRDIGYFVDVENGMKPIDRATSIANLQRTDMDAVTIPEPPKPAKKTPGAKTLKDMVKTPGQRHDYLRRRASGLRGKGFTKEEIMQTLQTINDNQCQPPHSTEKLQTIVDDVCERYSDGGYHTTDAGNAQRLAALHGKNIRYSHVAQKWFIWDGTRWRKDETGRIMELAKHAAREIYREASKEPDMDRRKRIAAHGASSENAGRIRAMISLTQSEPGIPAQMELFDRDNHMLNVKNGTINLKTGELMPHRREDMITRLIPIEYDPEAKCPRWDQFLREVMIEPNGGLKVDFLKNFIGYTLTGENKERMFLILYGGGKNGKSTMLEVIRELMGDYGTATNADTFMTRKRGDPTNDLARLKGARYVSAIETEEDRTLAEAFIKSVTGGDTITARFLFEEFFDFEPQFKLWLASNHLPKVKGTDDAIWDRIALINFKMRYSTERPNEERTAPPDMNLKDTLKAELPGILAQAVEAAKAWYEKKLSIPDDVRKATQDYREEEDELKLFFDTKCVIGKDRQTSANAIYHAYADWAYEMNIKKPLTVKEFGTMLKLRGFVQARTGGGKIRLWKGVCLERDMDRSIENIMGGGR